MQALTTLLTSDAIDLSIRALLHAPARFLSRHRCPSHHAHSCPYPDRVFSFCLLSLACYLSPSTTLPSSFTADSLDKHIFPLPLTPHSEVTNSQSTTSPHSLLCAYPHRLRPGAPSYTPGWKAPLYLTPSPHRVGRFLRAPQPEWYTSAGRWQLCCFNSP